MITTVLCCLSVLSAELGVEVYEGGKPLPCRAWVVVGGKRYYKPVEPDCYPYERDRSFTNPGRFTLRLPAGVAVVHLERGAEYAPRDIPVSVTGDGRTTLRVHDLKRWITMRHEEWYSGDLHVHFGHDNPPVLKQLAVADDVNVVPALTYWNRFAPSWPAFPGGAALVVDQHHFITRSNMEIERLGKNPGTSVGALLIYNLPKPVLAGGHDHTNPSNAVYSRMAQQAGPAVVVDLDKPMWAENVVDVALGGIDVVQLCHNHFHRDRDLRYGWGMVSPELTGDGPAGDPIFRMTLALYYHWLNCGFRLGVSGGSAIGVMPVPAGLNRTYAYVDGPFTTEKFWRAVKQGRTFATSGPMLFFTAGEARIGDTLAIKTGRPVTTKLTVKCLQSTGTAEIVYNGTVVAEKALVSSDGGRGAHAVSVRHTFTPRRSGFLAARFRWQLPSGVWRMGHTSPVYVVVDEKPICSAASARLMLKWLDELEDVAAQPGRYAREEYARQAAALRTEARMKYESIVKQAQKVWGDG